ncbi:hypothetical protein FNB15_04680 [Ferrovibrio terrae]|uniref:DUF2846 domain-containing protein n=1 Tax=Ferrovibrio terrae TaxID=2594003 RepID=A0A516GYJ8_9PROT|nr:hypothetical protein [Ferrovibrio terrae]QDO96613.1 hypothetical protein FNB15_04680 [Ferrovibrio terrae]
MLRILATLIIVSVISGCAARGVQLKDTPALQPLAQGQARLFIYREAITGGIRSDMVRPDLLVNGRPIGDMQAGAVILLTVPAGSYHVELAPPPGGPGWAGYRPVGEGQRVDATAGSEIHLKVMMTRLVVAGSDFDIRLIEPGTAREEIQSKVLQQRSLPAP